FVQEIAQEILRKSNADELIEASPCKQEARVSLIEDFRLQRVLISFYIQPLDFRTRGHDGDDRTVGQGEHALDHLLLFMREQLLFLRAFSNRFCRIAKLNVTR